MKKIKVKSNPTKVATFSVVFRNKKGKFSKPHQASFATFKPLHGKTVTIELNIQGSKTKAKVFNAVKSHAAAIENKYRAKKYLQEEKRRKKIPALPKEKVTKLPKHTVKHDRSYIFSKRSEIYLDIQSSDFIFKNKIRITQRNADQAILLLAKYCTTEIIKLFRAKKLSGYIFFFKIFGEGLYYRDKEVNGRMRRIPDQFGFALARHEIEKEKDLIWLIEETLTELLSKLKGADGYLERKVKKNPLFITGFRLEYIKEDR